MAKSSWRFEFVDINKSIPTTEAETKWIGYMVVRAPKGEAEAQYIPPNNPNRIRAMFGYPSADYPDLYEAIDFNVNYGLYLSAPSANVDTHPNYYGGIYFTKRGIFPVYRFTNKKKPNFEIGIEPGKELAFIKEATSATTITASLDDPSVPSDQSFIDFTNVPLSLINKCSYLDFDDWKTGKTFRYRIDRANGLIVDPSTNTVCGTMELSEDKYHIHLGGNGDSNSLLGGYEGVLNTLADSKVPFIKLSNLKDIKGKSVNYKVLIGTGEGAFTTFKNGANDGVKLLDAIIGGKNYAKSESNYDHTFKPLSSYFHFVYDIEDDVYSYTIQTSPTEQETKINLDTITYDKYIYDKKLKYVVSSSSSITADLPAKETDEFKSLAGDNHCVLVVKAGGSVPGDLSGVWQYNFSQKDNPDDTDGQPATIDIGWERQDSFETDKILAYEPVSGSPDREVNHSIYYIEDTYVEEMREDRTSEPTYLLKKNVMYNSFHCGSSEIDTEGEIHECASFIGSLDEFGVDQNGTDNYWEEILPPGETVTFAETYVVRTFDDDLDAKGVFTGTRVDKYEGNVKGQRYLSYLVDTQVQNGYTGCETDIDQGSEAYKGFTKCISLGLEEAAAPKYEDAIVFMECSGIDEVKSQFNAIRTNHKMATIISPKNINSSLFESINKVRVINPLRGSAQYCQEFQYKDKNLRKKYYSCPIGAIGGMLMRIIERFYGGVAPMWINDNDVGGQIAGFMQRTPIKVKWDFEDSDTEILDKKGINPILMDVEDGVMITSHRTTEMDAGDWGYLGHSMSFDLCKREIRDTVMKPQIGKKINSYWIEKRQTQTDNILRKRTTGTNACWAWTKCDIASVNTEYTKSQKIFNISVEVKPDPFAEKVRLTFTNVGSTSIVSD